MSQLFGTAVWGMAYELIFSVLINVAIFKFCRLSARTAICRVPIVLEKQEVGELLGRCSQCVSLGYWYSPHSKPNGTVFFTDVSRECGKTVAEGLIQIVGTRGERDREAGKMNYKKIYLIDEFAILFATC